MSCRRGCIEGRVELDPIMVFVMSLFATPAVSDDRIAQTNGASADDPCGGLGPVCFEVLRSRKWDKENRVAWALRGVVTLPRS